MNLRGRRMLVVLAAFATLALGLVVWDHFGWINVAAVLPTVAALGVLAVALGLTLRERERAIRAAESAGVRAARAEGSLRGSDHQYRLLFESNPNPMWVHDSETYDFLAVNDAAIEHYGYSREEFLSMNVIDIRSPEQQELLRAHLADRDNPAYQQAISRHRLRDGREIDVEVLVNDIEFEGRPGRFALAIDVTERRLVEQSLRASEKQFRDLFENAGEPIATVDLAGVITEVNGAFARVLGYSRDSLIGTQINDHVVAEDQIVAVHARERKLAGEIDVTVYEQVFLASDGRRVTMEVSTRVIEEDGKAVGIQGMCRDISDRKRAEAELRRLAEVNQHQALHDALTGLPNRVAFLGHVARAIAAAGTEQLAVLLLDVDRFKEINDTLGHHDGDRLLRELAQRLRGTLRDGDLVARLGGDEFGILLEGARDARSTSQHTIERITKALDPPVLLQGLPITIEVSTGVALHPADGEDADTLLQHADVAMYVAKGAPRGHAYYSREHHDLDTDRLTLIGELRRAIDRQELFVEYQPIVALETGAFVRAEALVRWQHPSRGLLSPGEFIPVAERTGLITPLTLYVLDAALAECSRWEQPGAAPRVSVNISVRCLLDPDFPAQVEAVLAGSQASPERLVLEVTESAIMLDPHRAGVALAELAGHGIGIAVDDFGTGYSSLAYLTLLPLDELKIDRAFVTNLATDPDSATIVRSIVHLAHDLGLKVVAEGVETDEVWALLREGGCDLAQGFLVARPLSREIFAQRVKTGTRARPGIAA